MILTAIIFCFRKAWRYRFRIQGGKHRYRSWFAIYLQREEGKCKIRIFDRWPESQTSGREYADSKGSARPHNFTPPADRRWKSCALSAPACFFALRHSYQLEIFETFPSTTFCPSHLVPRALASFLFLTERPGDSITVVHTIDAYISIMWH